MITPPAAADILLYSQPTDMRKGFDGLSGLVRSALKREPTDGSYFLFINRRCDRIKILYRDRDGLALWYKKLEAGTYQLPVVSDGAQGVEIKTIKELTHRLYGRRSERFKIAPDQLSLDFGDSDSTEGVPDVTEQVVPDVTEDEAFVEEQKQKRRRRRKKKLGGRFPEHIERRTERIEPDLPEGIVPEDCQLIGVDVVEIMEFDRPQLWIRRLEYPKYRIPDQSQQGVVQGVREVNLIPGGSFGFGIAAEVLFNKFALHIPLYRQQDPFAQLGWAPSRSTLGQILLNSAELMRPLAQLEAQLILGSGVVNTDVVYNAREQHPELSSQILALYRALYDIEERGSRLDPIERLLLRRRESVPLMKRMEILLKSPAAQNLLPKSSLGKAIGYLRNNWSALKRFLGDGKLPIDNNDAERDLRRIAVGRKNWLFVGSQDGGERASVILTVIASAHRHDLDVWAYLRDVLERLARGEDDLESLLPDVWKAAHPQHVRAFREEERERRAEDRRYRRAKRRIAVAKS